MTGSIPSATPPGEQPAAAHVPGGTPPPPPPPPPGSPPGITRSKVDRYIAGVCGGLGAHFHADPLVFRVAFALLTFAGGIGVLLYIAAWVLIPEAGSAQRAGWDSLVGLQRGRTRVVAAGLIAVLALVLFANSWNSRHEGLFWGVALVAVGAILFVWDGRRHAPSFRPTPLSDPTDAYAAGSFAPTPAASAASQWTSIRSPRPRSVLGLVTVATALLAVGVAALLDSAGVVSVSLGTGSAIALMVVGAGLIAGSWFGRSRALIVLGVVLVPFTAAATLVKEPLSGGTGTVVVAPQTVADLRSPYHLVAGDLTVDLSQLPPGASPNVTVTVALGRLMVVVPPQANIEVQAHTGAGQITLFGATDDGVNIDSPASQSPSPGAGTLHLALSVGLGELDVVYPPVTPAQGP